jgi:segregation and condensation protein B
MDEHTAAPAEPVMDRARRAAVEAIVYVADEPVTPEQIAAALEGATRADVLVALASLQNEYAADGRGIEIREIADGFKMFTKPEHHDVVRRFVKSLTPPLRLSMAALETLATIAYRQPVTVPEIQAIRGVQGAGVLKTLLDRKLIATAGRKQVLGRPILYKTTREFLMQFGLSSLQDLPSMEEFEEILKASFGESPPQAAADHSALAPASSPEDSPGDSDA